MLSQLRAGAAALRMSDPDFRQGYPFTVQTAGRCSLLAEDLDKAAQVQGAEGAISGARGVVTPV